MCTFRPPEVMSTILSSNTNVRMLSTLQYRKLWQKAGLAEENVTCIGLSPDGEYLAVGGHKEISLLTTERGDIKCCLRGRGQVTGLQWSPTGTLVGTFEDGVIVGVTLSTNGQLDLTCEEAQSHQIHFSSLDGSGSRLATGWNEAQRIKTPSTYLGNHLLPVEVVSLHWRRTSRTKEVVLVSYKHHGVQAWDPDASLFQTPPILNTSQQINRTSLSPNGLLLVVVMKRSFDLHSLTNRTPTISLSHDGNLPKAVEFVHNGEALSGAYRKGQVRLWNSSDGTKLQTLTHSSNTSVKSISGYSDKSDNFWLVTASRERIVMWKAEELPSRSSGEVTSLGLNLFTQTMTDRQNNSIGVTAQTSRLQEERYKEKAYGNLGWCRNHCGHSDFHRLDIPSEDFLRIIGKSVGKKS
ncbi:WD40 repeat-like protein [Panus rudis PR-1116 ss-1]|nr:WD40 repeat-like protein [Panus rudis PR-1116 ss-1]